MKKQLYLKKFLSLFLIISLLFTTIAYSGLSTMLAITSEAVFRPYADIRITNIALKEVTNGSIENYSPLYSKDTTTTGFTLPDQTSSITYSVTVENNGDIDQTIYDIGIDTSNNSNVSYEILGEYKLKDIIGFKSQTTLLIKFTTTEAANNVNIVLNFDFRKVYNIEYDSNGGTNTPNSQIKYEGVGLNLTTEKPQKEGYTFVGWADEATAETEKFLPGDLYELDKDILLYAVWQVKKSTLTVDPNGGVWGNSTNPQTFTQDYESTKSIDVPSEGSYYTITYDLNNTDSIVSESETKAYRTFIGWTIDGGGSITSLTPLETSTQVYTFGMEDSTLTANYTLASNNTTLAALTKEKYICSWNTKSDGTGTSYASEETVYIVDQDTTLYAVCTPNVYVITLSSEGATTDGTNEIYLKYDTGVYLDSSLNNQMTTTTNPIIVPTKTGYIFTGYYANVNSTGTKLIDSNGNITSDFTNTIYNSDTTIYAGYTKNSYSLTIDYNDGETSAEIYMLGFNETKDIQMPVREGYIFDGWTLTGEGSTMTSLTGDSKFTMGMESAILTASWTPITYEIKYDGNGSTSGSMENSTHVYDVDKNLSLNLYMKEGYTFAGWATSNTSSTAEYTDSKSIKNLTTTNEAVVTLYAVWQINSYTLTIDPDGGSWDGTTQTQSFTLDYNMTKTISNPSKTGYIFMSWSVTGTGSTISDGLFTMGYQDTILKAIYTPDTFTITLDNQSATTDGTTVIYEKYNTGIYLDSSLNKKMTETTNAITIPEKDGYAFLGYYTEENGAGTQLINSSGFITSDFTNTLYTNNKIIYAYWKRITASDLYYDNSNLNLDCTVENPSVMCECEDDNATVQCAIDKLNEYLGN